VRDSQGRYFAISVDRRQVVAFDAQARFDTAFGTRGDGPGEISSTGISRLFVGRGDHVFIVQGNRVTMFGPNFRAVNSFRGPAFSVYQMESIPAGGFVMTATLRTPGQVGFPFHVLDEKGGLLRSIGDAKINHHLACGMPPDEDGVGPRFMLAPDGLSIWVAPAGRVRQYMISGRAGAAFDVIDRKWFPAPKDSSLSLGRSGETIPIKVGCGFVDIVNIDDNGVLWLSAGYPTREARPGRRWLVAVDSRTGTILAETEVTAHVSGGGFVGIGNNLARTLTEDRDGIVTYRIWRTTLRGR
jgi:hypothetical protein